MGIAFLLALSMAPAVFGSHDHHGTTVHLWNWIDMGSLHVPMALLVDPLSLVMVMVVTGVGFLIHVYAIGYMEGDERFNRFFLYLNLFILAMLLLVLGDSFLTLFIGWEGVGLASFLLIGFWFDRKDDLYGSFADCGKKAFIVNRIGDVGMILAMALIWSTAGSLEFNEVFHELEAGAAVPATAVCLLLLLAVAGKSAQFPLYVWLPDAMAGPTPVSALIHAATMVTAGIYLMAPHPRLLGTVGHGFGHGRLDRGRDRLRGRHHGPGPARSEEGAGLLDRVPAGLHGPGGRDRRLRPRHLPSGYACLLQGAPVPERRQRPARNP